ncbi:MAG: low temperature requirement protein A [Gaiellales bacterium]
MAEASQPIDAPPPRRLPRMSPAMREGARVTPLELFFDLVFVLALTESTTYMDQDTTWRGVLRAMLVLGVLWWSWCGYAWLTSVIDPEAGAVRIVMFCAMAGLLVAALCVPNAFGGSALLFAVAYAAVRVAHLVLFTLASSDDPALRHSVSGLAVSSAIGVGILIAAAYAPGWWRESLWGLALLLDMGGPFLFGTEGWRLVPGHFAERHEAIVIIALGESVVAIGVGSEAGVGTGVVVTAMLGVAVAAAVWWLYFDVVALVVRHRLERAAPGRERNCMARDSYSYLHFPMVAGIALIALGLKKTLAHVDDPLPVVAAAALFGGAAVYLVSHVIMRLRNLHTLNRQRLACAFLLIALIPLADHIPSLASVAVLAGILSALIAYEAIRFSASRERIRTELATLD